MKFTQTKLSGSYVIELDKLSDERGFFARSFCKEEFKKLGLNPEIVQCNISYNNKAGTLRGMHFQKAPHEETKIISCIKGAIYDVIIDLRPESITYKHWLAVELNEKNQKMLYVPKGFAHGFQALLDDTIVQYQMGEFYHPEASAGIRWDDPEFNIKWLECEKLVISDKDRSYGRYI